jgi:hypothetical protein
MNILEEFDYRRGLLNRLNYREASDRLKAFRVWFLEVPVTRAIHDDLYARMKTANVFRPGGPRGESMSVVAATPEEIAFVGFEFIKIISEKIMMVPTLAHEYGIRPSHLTSNVQAHFDEVMRRYIDPAVSYLRRELERSEAARTSEKSIVTSVPGSPIEITESLARLRMDHPDPTRTAFIMMRFSRTPLHEEIVTAIRGTLGKAGLAALRADDKEYHDDLFLNVTTYMHGCAFGIAVFERLEMEDFNPNVSLEVGYMQALRKSVCLLKDKTLKTLHVDLVGKLYRSFDPQAPAATIPGELERWMRDKGLGR